MSVSSRQEVWDSAGSFHKQLYMRGPGAGVQQLDKQTELSWSLYCSREAGTYNINQHVRRQDSCGKTGCKQVEGPAVTTVAAILNQMVRMCSPGR